MKRRVLSVILTFAMVLSMLPATALAAGETWDGTTIDTSWYENNSTATTFTITTPAQLAGLAQLVNGRDGTSAVSFSNKTITLGADLNLGDKAWTPIGGTGHPFSGTFDGGDHRITGLYIDAVMATEQGLFGNVTNGTVQDLSVVGSIKAKTDVGGIVGRLDSSGSDIGRVVNCSFEGNLIGEGDQNSGLDIGGIVGYNHNGLVSGCRSSAVINLKAQYVGGIVGYNYSANGVTAKIENCVNKGTITISGKDASAAGGIAGFNGGGGEITNCYNTGTVSGTDSVGMTGGIVGYNNGSKIIRCYNTGKVDGSKYVGGIAGESASKGTVEQCYNAASGIVNGTSQVGGVVGQNDGGSKVNNCYHEGAVSGTSSVGGIVGQNNDGKAKSTTIGNVLNCYNKGSATGNSGSTGGIVGNNATGTGTGKVDNCYYLSTATADTLAVSKTPAQFASGEVAWLLQNPQNNVDLFWGQELRDGKTKDAWPLLVNVESAKETSRIVPRVIKVTFTTTENTIQTNYTNVGGAVPVPADRATGSGYVFFGWHVGSIYGRDFTTVGNKNVIEEDDVTTTIDLVTIMAVQRELFGGDGSTIELHGVYGNEAALDLKPYIAYANGSEVADKFAYTITNYGGLAGATINNGVLDIPGDGSVNAGTYTLTITATEKTPQVSPYSVSTVTSFGTGDVTLTVKVVIDKATPALSGVTAGQIAYGMTIGDSELTGTATHPDQGWSVDGDFAWETPGFAPPAGSGTYKVNFTPAPNSEYDRNYNSASTEVSLVIDKAPAAVSVPPEALELTYNGNAQALVKAGTTDHGEMWYSLSPDGGFGPDIPVETNADTYTVYYKVAGDANHTDSGMESIQVTIHPYRLTLPALSFVYNGGKTLTTTVTGVTPDHGDAETVTVTLTASDKNAGTYTFNGGTTGYTAAIASPNDTNYTVAEDSEPLTIKPRPVSLRWDGQLIFVYDSNATNTVTAEVDNKVDGDDVKVASYKEDLSGSILYTNSATDVGDYTAEAAELGGTDRGNYTLKGGLNLSQAWHILQADSNITMVPTNPVYGDTLTLSTTLKADAANKTIKFYVNGKLLGEAVADSDGNVSYTVTATSANNLFAGPNPVTAVYEGDKNTAGSTAAAIATVTPKPITASITGDNTTKVYDGDNIASGLNVELTVGGENGIEACDVGQVTAAAGSFTYDSKGVDATAITANDIKLDGPMSTNYVLKEEDVTTEGSITPKPVTLQWSNYTGLVYNGGEKNVTATVVGLVGDDECDVTVKDGNGTDAGLYTAVATLENANYTIGANATQEYTIDKADLSVTAPVPTNPTYSGSTQALVTAGEVEDQCGADPTHTGAGTILYSIDGENYTTDIPKHANAREYTVWYKVVGDKNHKDIDPQQITVTISPFVLDIPAKEFLYDGNTVFMLELTGADGSKMTVTLTTSSRDVRDGGYAYDTATRDGKYTVTLPNENYTVGTAGTLIITPRPVVLSWQEPLTFVYNGKQRTVTATVTDGVGNDTFTLEYSGNTGTDAKEYKAEVTALGNPNYTLDPAKGAQHVEQVWYITEADDTVTLDASGPVTYGQDITFTATIVVAGGADVAGTVAFSVNGIELAEKATVVEVKEEVDSSDPSQNTTDSVRTGTATITVKAISKNGFSAASLNTVIAKYDSTNNSVKDKEDVGTVNVTPKEITAAINGTATKTYDGTVDATGLELKLVDGGVEEGDTVDVTATHYTYDSPNAGEDKTVTAQNVELTGAQRGNYTLKVEPIAGTIEQKEVSLEWSGYTGLVYDGTKKNITATATGLVAGDTCGVVVEGGNEINANTEENPSYTAKAVRLSNGNYKLPANVEQPYTIAKADPVVTPPTPNDLGYTGEKQTLVTAGKTTGGELQYSIDGENWSTEPPSETEAGTYTVWYKVVGDDNYNDVAPRAVEVTIRKNYTPPRKPGTGSSGGSTTKPTGNSGYANCPKDETCPIWPFADANPKVWYHDGVHYCIENGLMRGYGNHIFKPNDTLSRAMLAQILYNREGRPHVSGVSPFTDVADGAWYTDAIIWAAANGVVLGYGGGLYGPEDPVTREQLAAMLYRYERSQGGGFTGDWMFPLNFTDAADVSGWAYEAMCWCHMNGIVVGKGNGILDPGGNATRAEAALMVMRFFERE